jgi:hypothetical protein
VIFQIGAFESLLVERVGTSQLVLELERGVRLRICVLEVDWLGILGEIGIYQLVIGALMNGVGAKSPIESRVYFLNLVHHFYARILARCSTF